jgi:dTDP-4-amino-4,6-dideoxygalactose transaminase
MSVEPVRMAAFDREWAALRTELEPAIARVFESGRFILGVEVAAFEAEMGTYLGGAHAVGCANGTDALVLALRALGIGAGDEVIVPAFTFAATAEAVVLAGATPVFADIDPETLTIDAESARERVTSRTRAIIPVHLFGRCARMDLIQDLASRSGAFLIEDAAQAAGARWRGTPAGALGDVAAFSFHPTKNLSAPGDAGMVTSRKPEIAERVRRLRVHGSRRPHLHEEIGCNSRLDELHAAVLRLKLRRLDGSNARRRAIAAHYRSAMTGGRARAQAEQADGEHVYHQFTVTTPERSQLEARLEAAGVEHAIYYQRPLHRQPAYERWSRAPLPVAERASLEVLSVPVHPWLSDAEVERVAAALAS